jgi:long-subunit fatty acid transport protein
MKKITLYLSLLCFLSVKSQTDFGLWSNIAVEKEISKKMEIQLEEELRFNQNVGRLNSLLTEAGFKYKINKYYSLGASYRFTYYTENRFGNRFTLSNQVKYKIEDFTLNYRLNLQTDFSTKDPVEYKIRNKFGVDYKINKRWEIGVSGELFYSFYYNRNRFDRYRLAYGVDYSFKKRHKLSASLMFQQEFNVANPESDVILAFKYKYSLKNKKKK